MKRLLLFLGPIILGLLVFLTFLFFFSKSGSGNGALQVTAVPVSNVYLNGKLLGKTPLCKCEGKDMIPSGTYTIKLAPLAGDNLQPYEETVSITKGILTVVDRTFGVGEASTGSVITLIPFPNASAIQAFIASFPSDVSVQIDGNDSGKTPFLAKNLTASDHEVVLSKDGYKDKTVHIHTVAGYQLKALITLGIIAQTSTQAANFQNASLTPVEKAKVTILDTPTGFLRVRSDPSLGASETAQVKPGEVFPFQDEQNGWYQIQLPDGKLGWVNSQYAQKK